MRKILDLLKRLFGPVKQPQTISISPKAANGVVRQVAMTHEVEYSCDEVLGLLDQFAEAVLRGENVAELMPLVLRHLEMCKDCHEEFEALLRILRASPSESASG